MKKFLSALTLVAVASSFTSVSFAQTAAKTETMKKPEIVQPEKTKKEPSYRKDPTNPKSPVKDNLLEKGKKKTKTEVPKMKKEVTKPMETNKAK